MQAVLGVLERGVSEREAPMALSQPGDGSTGKPRPGWVLPPKFRLSYFYLIFLSPFTHRHRFPMLPFTTHLMEAGLVAIQSGQPGRRKHSGKQLKLVGDQNANRKSRN